MANGRGAWNESDNVAARHLRTKGAEESRTLAESRIRPRAKSTQAPVSCFAVFGTLPSASVGFLRDFACRRERPGGPCVKRSTARDLAGQRRSLSRDSVCRAAGRYFALAGPAATRFLDRDSGRNQARQRLRSK